MPKSDYTNYSQKLLIQRDDTKLWNKMMNIVMPESDATRWWHNILKSDKTKWWLKAITKMTQKNDTMW